MKTYHLIFIVLLLISCNKNNDERLITDVNEILPGKWKIEKLINLTSDSLNFKNTYYKEGSYLLNFGSITIPQFNLDYDDDNFISIILIPCEYNIEQFSYPFNLTNQTLINGFQCELQPNNSVDVRGSNEEVEGIINNFKIFHTYYEIKIKSSDAVEFISRYRDTEIIISLVRV